METAEQVEAYANADFAVPHSRVIELFREVFPGAEIAGAVLDAGCGTGDISVRFARAFPHCRVTGVDGSTAMLKKGAEILSREPAELRTQVALIQGLLPDAPVTPQAFATILSNSLLHHLHDPQVMWKTVRNFAYPTVALRPKHVDLNCAKFLASGIYDLPSWLDAYPKNGSKSGV